MVSLLPFFLSFMLSNTCFNSLNLQSVSRDAEEKQHADKPIRIRVRQEDDEAYHEIMVNPNETILAALERSGLSELPSDCRRGNCLTCAAYMERVAATESDTGLTQTAASYLGKQSLILTCSTYVLQEGLTLQLGQCDEAWKQVYQQRLYEGEPEFAQTVRARAIRKIAERNVVEWMEETKRALDASSADED